MQLVCRTFGKPSWNVPHSVQNPPYVNVVVPLDVEHQMGIVVQRPVEKPRYVEFMRVAGQAGSGVPSDMGISRFQGVDES